SSSDSSCPNSVSIPDRYFDNKGKFKPYDLTTPVMIPCDTSAFSVSFDVTSDSDFFVAFTQTDGYYGSGGVVETQIGIVSGTNSVRKGRYAQTKRSLLTKRSVSAPVTLTYDGSILSIIVNGTKVLNYTVKNFNIKQFYMVPYSGTARVSNMVISCASIRFKINGVDCLCTDDGSSQCTGITYSPEKYKQCLNEHSGNAAFKLGEIDCFCLQDGTIQCLNIEQSPNRYQQCLRDHGGKAAFKDNGKDCFCIQDGTTLCSDPPKPTPTPAPITYQQCLRDHDGKSSFDINGSICSCNLDGTMQCPYIIPSAEKYKQCLNEHNGKAAFNLTGLSCFCLQDGTIQCLGKEQYPNTYQRCLRNNAGLAAFKLSGKDCFCIQDGTVQCTS
ncbi:hypothetical protein BB558_007514, partial [Smittium angustum]